MSYDPNRVLDLRFFGFNAAGNIGGQYGQAWANIPNKYFNYLLVAGDALDFRFGFTYETWLRRTGGFGVWQGLFGKTNGGGALNFGGVLRLSNANLIRLSISDGAVSRNGDSVSTILDTNLHHIVATFDLTTIRIYIDGILDNASANALPNVLSCAGFNFEIGKFPQFAGEFFTGEYESIRVYDRVFGDSEIRSNYQYGPNRT
jgi:hypothetical protein